MPSTWHQWARQQCEECTMKIMKQSLFSTQIIIIYTNEMRKCPDHFFSCRECYFPPEPKTITAIKGQPCGFCESIEDLTFSETCKSLKPVWKNLLTCRKSATPRATTWTLENVSCYTINSHNFEPESIFKYYRILVKKITGLTTWRLG